MTDTKKAPDAAADPVAAPGDPAMPGAAPAGPAPDDPLLDPVAMARQLAGEVVKLEGQVKDLTDRLLRAHADLDNLRKRAEREREETAKYAITKFACDIVGVSDNFQRALTAVPVGAADADPALGTLIEGVSMTEAELIKVMERHGVRRIDPIGQPFSPHHHQAMMEREDASVASGTILQVFQPGYMIDGRVIRPAMVVVAKGGQKQPKPEAQPANDDTPPPSSGPQAGNDTGTSADEAANGR